MELEHSFTVPVPEDRAWDVLLDVERVAPCMPGATLQSIDGDEIRGAIKVKVGPISMTYQGTARFTERDPAAHVITLEASGKETRGAGTASAKVRSTLEAQGDETHVVVHTTLNVTGKPAQFGRGVMTEVGGRLIGIFADNLAAMLAAGPAQEAAATTGSDAEEKGNGLPQAGGAFDEALPIDVLNLPSRAWSSLRRDGIQTVGDLTRRTEHQLLAIENIGPASVAEISRRLADHGLALAKPAAGTEQAGQAGGQTDGAARHAAGSAADSEARAPAAGAEAPAAARHDGTHRAGAHRAETPLATGAPSVAGTSSAAGTAAGSAAASQPEPGQPAGGAQPAPREPVGWQPNDDAIDLLGVAGLPVLKRALPVAAALLALLFVVLGVRRRRSRRG
jgi:carbon monoxide dehydrogenase subunit G